jgi:hypothetical protein
MSLSGEHLPGDLDITDVKPGSEDIIFSKKKEDAD